ncbi:hypothetical protein ACEQPO_27235 [Bacillus sp. SL00103]
MFDVKQPLLSGTVVQGKDPVLVVMSLKLNNTRWIIDCLPIVVTSEC